MQSATLKKDNTKKFIHCIHSRLYLDYLIEYKANIFIVNYLTHLLRFDMILETDNNESVKYNIIMPNIKLKN